MKKTEIKKLRINRETLLALTSSEGQRVVGGTDGESFPSSQSNGGACCDKPFTVALTFDA
jgi:hypothetical protein